MIEKCYNSFLIFCQCRAWWLDVDVAYSGCGKINDKFIKNYLNVFERGENLLQNGMLHFCQKSR